MSFPSDRHTMTTTNRAFIKAYRNDAPQTAPHHPVVAGQAAALARAAVGTSERSVSSASPPHPSSSKQPLSSFLDRSGARPLKGRAEANFLRPGTTVASFHWPPVCRTLAQQCGAQLDHLAEAVISQADKGRRLIGVIALHAGQGATTLAMCLAARLAGRGRQIILVDGNFIRPSLAQTLEVVPTAGLQEVLRHGAPLADAVIRASDNQLDLLALGTKPSEDKLRLVSSLQMVVTAGVLRHAYELVLIDAGAANDPAAHPILETLARNLGLDTALAVTGPQPTMQEVDALAEMLSRSGCELLGIVENRVPKT